MKELLLTGIGGAAGSMLRYSAGLIPVKIFQLPFPFATFIVNLTGCLLFGLIAALFPSDTERHQAIRLLLLTGFCGGFTTFSAFAAENFRLLHTHPLTTLLYILCSVLLGILAVWSGLRIGTLMQ